MENKTKEIESLMAEVEQLRKEVIELKSRENKLGLQYKIAIEKEENYKLLIENQNDLIVKVDLDGNLLFVSPSYCAVLGKSEADILGKAFMPLEHEDDQGLTAENLKRMVHPPYSCRYEQRIMTSNGWRWFEWSNKAIFNGNGKIEYIIGVGRDIEEKKNAQEILNTQYNLLRIAGEKARFGGWSVDLSNNRATWSDEVAAIHEEPAGYSPLVSEGINYYAPKWRNKITEVFTSCAKLGIPYNEEMEIITAKGNQVWVRTIGYPVRNENGKIVKVQGAFQDINKLKKAEDELKLASENWNKTFHAMNDCVLLLNAEQKIIQSNKAFQDFVGKNEAELKNNPCFKFVHGTDYPPSECIFQKMKKSGKREKTEMKINSRFYEISVDPLFDENKVIIGAVHIISDITIRKNAEKTQKILFEVTKSSMNSKSLEELLTVVQTELSSFIDAGNFFVALYNPETDLLRKAIFVDEKDDLTEWKAENSLSGQVAKSKKTLLLDRIQINQIAQKYHLQGTPAECWLGVPLMTKDIVIGVMVVQSYTNPNAYDETSVSLMEMIAHELTVVIERSAMFKNLVVAKQNAEENEHRVLVQKSEIELYNNRLESLLRIAQYPTNSIQMLLDFALEEAIQLTSSKIGYIYFYNEITRQFTLNTWSKEVMPACEVMDQKTVYNLDDTGCWGEAVRQRIPIVMNDYTAENPYKKGTPTGHIVLKKFLTIPVIMDEKIVAVAGVANKESDYNTIDIRQLTLLMDNVWKISERVTLVENLKIAKETAEENETRFKALHNATFGGIAIHDKGIILDCNQGLSEISGYNQEELIGMNGVLHLIAEESRELVIENIKNDYEKAYEVFGLRKNGEKYPLRLEARNIPYIGLRVRTVEFRDVTLQKKAETDLIAAKEKAEKSDRLKTAFINNISHEIRTPLNGILGFGELMTDSDLSQEERREYFKRLEQSSNRLLQTITDFMDISLIVSGNLKINNSRFGLQSLFENLLNNTQKKCFNRNIEIRLELPQKGRLIYLNNDSELIHKVLGHFLSNAIKFTKSGIVRFGYKTKADYIEFFVSDTGCGISTENQKTIFQTFVQGDSSDTRGYEGNGLGLAISSRIIELLGGHIRVKSQLSVGSTFYITIPHNPEENTSINSEIPNKKQQKDMKELCILVAEDDNESSMILGILLKRMGFTAIFASDGAEIVQIFKENQNASIILMDIKMPVKDGYEATREIRKINEQIPIIAQTAFVSARDKEMAIEAGCNDIITKPIIREVLYEVIKKYAGFEF